MTNTAAALIEGIGIGNAAWLILNIATGRMKPKKKASKAAKPDEVLFDGSDDGTIQIWKVAESGTSLSARAYTINRYYFKCVCGFKSKIYDGHASCVTRAMQHKCEEYNAYGQKRWNPDRTIRSLADFED